AETEGCTVGRRFRRGRGRDDALNTLYDAAGRLDGNPSRGRIDGRTGARPRSRGLDGARLVSGPVADLVALALGDCRDAGAKQSEPRDQNEGDEAEHDQVLDLVGPAPIAVQLSDPSARSGPEA